MVKRTREADGRDLRQPAFRVRLGRQTCQRCPFPKIASCSLDGQLTSWIPLSRMCRCMNGRWPILHQTRRPSSTDITIYRATTCDTISISRITVQRRHQGGCVLRSRTIPDSHIRRRGPGKRRTVDSFFLPSMSGRALSSGRTATTGEIPLTHDWKSVLCMDVEDRRIGDETGVMFGIIIMLSDPWEISVTACANPIGTGPSM